MNALPAILIAIIQGATELFPVSSLGHAVLVPAVLDWRINQDGPVFLPFLVLLHVGTAIALLGYFWRDWLALARGVLGQAEPHAAQEARRVLLLIVIATIPAVLVGGVLEHALRSLFASPLIVAIVLALNGALLLFGERLRARIVTETARPLSGLTPLDAVVIGLWQCLALIPGFSRSGATIVGGLLRGINHEGSAHFSFLIATPIILGATALEVPKLLRDDVSGQTLQTAVLAAIVAGIVAWLSTAFLMRYFRNHDRWALAPFAWYCVVAGLGVAAYLGLA